MFTNTKVAPGYFLEGSGFDRPPNYEGRDLSQQPRGDSKENTDAIAAGSARAQILADKSQLLQANDQIIATRDLAVQLGIPDNTREVNGVKIEAMDGDIRLSIGDKVQIIPKSLFERHQDTFINQFAANNGVTAQKGESPQAITVVKAPAARPAATVAAAPKGPTSLDARKPVPTMGEQTTALQNKIKEIDALIIPLQNKIHNIGEAQLLAQYQKQRGQVNDQLHTLTEQQNKLQQDTARGIELAGMGRQKVEVQLQAEREYAKLSPAGKAVKDLDVALKELLKREITATGNDRQAIRKEANIIFSNKLVAQQVVGLEDQIASLNKEQPPARRGGAGMTEWTKARDENVAKLQGQKDSLMVKLHGTDVTKYAGRGLTQKTA